MASISARGSAAAALGYYDHLQCDDYYSRGGEPPGRQAGRGAERLSLTGPVTHTEFEASLQGLDPKTSEQLAQIGGRGREHSAGWDMTFSAPKSVSVLWALSDGPERAAIEQAHQSAGQTVRHGTPPLSESTKLASKILWARFERLVLNSGRGLQSSLLLLSDDKGAPAQTTGNGRSIATRT